MENRKYQLNLLFFIRLFVLAGLARWDDACHSQETFSTIQRDFDEGRAARERGDRAGAFEKFEGLRKNLKDATLRSDAALEAAQILRKLDPSPVKVASEGATVEELYGQAIREGTPRQRALAQHNLGTFLLGEGKVREAIDSLKNCDIDALPSNQAYAPAYFLGKAYEQAHDPDAAFESYVQSFKLRPSYLASADRAFQVAYDDPRIELAIRRSVDLGQLMIRLGQSDPGMVHIRSCFKLWGREADARLLETVLLTDYVSDLIDPAELNREILPTRWAVDPEAQKLANAKIRGVFQAFSPERGYALRLLPSAYARDLPAAGKSLIIVASVNQQLFIRIFDGEGRLAVDTNESRLPTQAEPIEEFRKQLAPLWSRQELTGSDKARLVAAIASIVGHIPEKLDEARTHREFLAAIQAECPPLGPDMQDVLDVFLEDIDSGFDRRPEITFARWIGKDNRYDRDRQRAFAAFLKLIGDYYLAPDPEKGDARNPGWALDRYAAAWVLDPANTAALLYAVMAIHAYPNEVGFDIKMYHQLLNKLYSKVGTEYAFPIVKAADRARVRRVHVMLHDLAGKRRFAATPTGRFNPAFHLEQADKLRRARVVLGVSAEDSEALPPIAEVQEGLAEVYGAGAIPENGVEIATYSSQVARTKGTRAASRSESLEQYLLAAEACLSVGEPTRALAALRAARGLSTKLTSAQSDRLARLEREAQEMKKSLGDLPGGSVPMAPSKDGGKMPPLPIKNPGSPSP